VAVGAAWLPPQGGADENLRQHAQARDSYAQAFSFYRALGDRRREAVALGNLGLVYDDVGQYARARDAYTQALVLFRILGDRGGEAGALNGLGRVYHDLGQYAQARDAFTQALVLFRILGDRGGEARALGNLGLVYDEWGQHTHARDLLTQALALYRTLGDRDREAADLTNLGLVYEELGQYAQARDFLTQALSLTRALGDRRGEASVLTNLSIVYDQLGQYAQTRDSYTQVLALTRGLGDRRGEARALDNLGVVHQQLGQYAQARDFFTQALALDRALGYRDGEASVLENLGVVYRKLGQYAQARDLLTQALALYRTLGDRDREATDLTSLGLVYDELGKYGQARDVLTQALALTRALGYRRGEASVLTNLSIVYDQLSQYGQARDLLTQALALARALGDRLMEASTAFDRGLAFEQLGRFPQAASDYRAAIVVIESLRGEAGRPEERVGFFENYVEPYDALVRVLLRQARAGMPGAAAEAFRVAEQGRARGVLDLLAEARARVTVGVDPRLVARETELNGELTALENDWRREMAKPAAQQNSTRLGSLTTRRLDLERGLRDVEQAVAARYPRYAELTRPTVADAAGVTAVLRPGEVLLEYFITDEIAAVWVVRAGHGVQVRWLPATGRAVAGLAARLQAQVRTPRGFLVSGGAGAANTAGFDLSAAHALYRDLVEPVRADLAGARTVFVVPHGPLLTLPLEVLVQGVTDQRGTSVALTGPRSLDTTLRPQYFGDTYALAYVPSASLLALLRREQAAPPGRASKPIVAFADPTYGADEGGGERGAVNRGAEESAAALRSPVTGLGKIKLTRLPYTGAEARAIGGLFGATGTPPLYLRERAAKATVEALSARGELAQYRYVHFATHGLLGNEVPGAALEPALVLSLVDPKDDGFLRMSDVLNLRLQADLVVLSACETGLGAEVKGEGLVGLTRAFMYAGTPTVVVSLWTVSDPATAALMTEFYRGLKGGLSKGEALRRAKAALRTEGYKDADGHVRSGANPNLWAPFILVGDPG